MRVQSNTGGFADPGRLRRIANRIARAFLADAVILRNMPRHVLAGFVCDAVRAKQAVWPAAVVLTGRRS